MHYHCEIIIPPTFDVESAVEKILTPFSKHLTATDEDRREPSFWDWFVIGGRWAGIKEQQRYGDRLDEFYDWLKAEKITVSGVQWGKQKLSPDSQILRVDAKWNEMFPSPDGESRACPLFLHSNHNDGPLAGDICQLGEAMHVRCERVIVSRCEQPVAEFMIERQIWNGVNFIDTAWDGRLRSALDMYSKKLENYRKEFREANMPGNDWLAVTVDYHS